jgi:2-polyprenyl-3-methyl-5-hydroxy-6-metoxy-1,4-benzoquinol methylase
MNSDMISYYRDRAKEYENIYKKQERQEDILHASKILQETFCNKQVFEIACGTGYWTEKISNTAHSILATDINDTMIEVAKAKKYSPAIVTFQKADLFNLPKTIKYESLFGGFIWSHIKIQELNNFIDIANNMVKPGGTIVFMDNNYDEASNLPVTEIDEFGNTYQTRKLENGSVHKVLKNFVTENSITQLLADKASEISFINLHYYWILKYKSN